MKKPRTKVREVFEATIKDSHRDDCGRYFMVPGWLDFKMFKPGDRVQVVVTLLEREPK